jgi:hypothetical protein
MLLRRNGALVVLLRHLFASLALRLWTCPLFSPPGSAILPQWCPPLVTARPLFPPHSSCVAAPTSATSSSRVTEQPYSLPLIVRLPCGRHLEHKTTPRKFPPHVRVRDTWRHFQRYKPLQRSLAHDAHEVVPIAEIPGMVEWLGLEDNVLSTVVTGEFANNIWSSAIVASCGTRC